MNGAGTWLLYRNNLDMVTKIWIEYDEDMLYNIFSCD